MNNDKRKAIGYIRCSLGSDRQVNSLNVQKSLIEMFCKQNNYDLVCFFQDEESGTTLNRSGMLDALAYVDKHNAILITKGCDRLSRSTEIWSLISDKLSKIRFLELGDNEPNVFICSILIATAHNEVSLLSQRLKQTFTYLKNQGRVFGNPDFSEKVRPIGMKVRVNNAVKFNTHIKQVATDLDKAGYGTLRSISKRLNELNILTRTKKQWTPQGLHRVLAYRPGVPCNA
jgi:DNA invertase Pin-like site-specific DNA recombinase